MKGEGLLLGGIAGRVFALLRESGVVRHGIETMWGRHPER